MGAKTASNTSTVKTTRPARASLWRRKRRSGLRQGLSIFGAMLSAGCSDTLVATTCASLSVVFISSLPALLAIPDARVYNAVGYIGQQVCQQDRGCQDQGQAHD